MCFHLLIYTYIVAIAYPSTQSIFGEKMVIQKIRNHTNTTTTIANAISSAVLS